MGVIRPTDSYFFQGTVGVDGTWNQPSDSVTNASIQADADIVRTKMAQETNKVFALPVWTWKQHDTGDVLPVTDDGSDDLWINADNWGTDGMVLSSDDANAAAKTQYAMNAFCLPPEYDDGETITLRIPAKMGVIADTTNSLDLVCYEDDYNQGIGADICATAAQTMTASWANYDFTITATTVARGDMLLFRITVALDDTAAGSGAGVVANLGHPKLLLDIRG